MALPARHLVIGGDGFIGRALAQELRASGANVIATTRRSGSSGWSVLDLENVADWQPPRSDIVYLCAAIADLKYCEAHPAQSRRINVDGAVEVARRSREQGAFVVFLSTNLVFDGLRPFPREDTAPSPTCEYGRQKAEAERQLLGLGNVAIVRLTKVIDRELPLIAGWREALLAGKAIKPFTDLILAPLARSYVVSALIKIGASRRPGIYHLSSADDIAYADFARLLARALGVSPMLVRPLSVAEAGATLVSQPQHAALGCMRTQEALGIAAPKAEACIAEIARDASVSAHA